LLNEFSDYGKQLIFTYVLSLCTIKYVLCVPRKSGDFFSAANKNRETTSVYWGKEREGRDKGVPLKGSDDHGSRKRASSAVGE
jgi:hypothetical protein